MIKFCPKFSFLIKKIKIIFCYFLLFSIVCYSFEDFPWRFTYKIKDEKENLVGVKVIHIANRPKIIYTYFYLFYNNSNYMRIIYETNDEYDAKQRRKNGRKKKLRKLKDVGIEVCFKILVNANGQMHHFKICGDTTYIYLKDEQGDIKRNEEAFEYMVSKVPEIEDFIKVMACDKKYFPLVLYYVLNLKSVKKKFNLNRKYRFIRTFVPFTDVEKSLGYDCSIYEDLLFKDENVIIY